MLDDAAMVPAGLRHERFVLAPLTTATASLDYAAYLTSPDVIRTHSDGRWPVEGFTFSDDLELVARHEDDHQSRRAFTFVLLSPSGTEALGCVYLNSLREYLLRVEAPRQLVDEWPLAAHAFRVLPGERSSCAALDRLGLRKLRLSFLGDERPYLWYWRSIWQLSRGATES
ncbi:hypothetical protein [Nocardioides dongkuii]|uniref:hypothetical protein n=1 Tax=Nocardioides dongkuii TaxID=2760089 RepID=UPI0018788DA5|nr:hypothetical protein [Nocardioides dongkuii]